MILRLFAWLNPATEAELKNSQNNETGLLKGNSGNAGGVNVSQSEAKRAIGAPMRLVKRESGLPSQVPENIASVQKANKASKGNPLLAVLIALLLTGYILFALFSWVSLETVFQREMFVLLIGFEYPIFPEVLQAKTAARYVTAKLLTFYLSYPLVVILAYLIYQWFVTSLHRFGSYCAKVTYITPEFRLRGVAFAAEIAPVFGIMSSLWALMNKGGDAEYVRWVMCGPSFLGMTAYAMAIIYLHWMPKRER